MRVGASLGVVVALLTACSAGDDLSGEGHLAFTGATVWDGTGAPTFTDATIVVDQEGRIVSVATGAPPAGATVVDLTDRFVVPGFVNAHGHVTGRWADASIEDPVARVAEDLRLYARYGVTTVASLGDSDEVIDIARSADSGDASPGARLVASGAVITSDTPEAAAETVDARLEAGADWVKFRMDDNLQTTRKMSYEVAGTIIERAHERGGRVATHLFYLEDAKALLEMGSDLIAHSIRDEPVDDAVIGMLRDSGVCYVPTLTRELSTFVYATRPDFFDDPFFTRDALSSEVERVLDPDYQTRIAGSRTAALYRIALTQALDNLGALSDAEVTIAMGTDSGPAGRFPGYFEHLEFGFMADAGLTPEEILLASTRDAARCLELDSADRFGVPVGTLEPGHAADFVVMTADPLVDIENTRTLERVFIGGAEVAR